MKRTIRYLLSTSLFLVGLLSIGHAQISTFPYTENFENGPGGYTTGANHKSPNLPPAPANNSWAFGKPAKTGFNTAASGDSCWFTQGDASGNYFKPEDSYLESPVFDFTSLATPQISFDLFVDVLADDGAALFSSVDTGKTWQIVGRLNSFLFSTGTYWYENSPLAGSPGGSSVGWGASGSSNGYFLNSTWARASHDISTLAGLPHVQFRWYFGTGTSGSSTTPRLGIGIDRVTVGEPQSFLLGASAMALCQGDTLTIPTLPIASYEWIYRIFASPNVLRSTSPQLGLTSSGYFHAIRVDSFGMVGWDTLYGIIGQPPQNVTITAANGSLNQYTLCQGDSIGLSVSTSSTGSFTYSWAFTPSWSQPLITFTNAQSFQVKDSGYYVVTVIGSNGCSAKDTFRVNLVPVFSLPPHPNVILCPGDSLYISTPISPVPITQPQVVWDWYFTPTLGQPLTFLGSNQILTVGTPGYYIVNFFLYGRGGCLAADTILLQISTVPSISINAPVTTFCSGDSTTVTATVSGMGNSFLGWEYTQALGQTPSFFSSDTSITVKDSGYYISMAANASGCIARDTLRITLLPKPLGTISTPGNTLCNTGGSITLSGPAGMNLYLWSTGNTGPNNIATVTGIYTLTVEDAAGCLSDPDSIEIKTGPNLGLTRSLNIISSTCSTANANVAFTPYGGIAPYRYTWQDGATSANRSFNTPGQYFVVVSDTNGCANQDTVNIPGSSIVVSDFLLSPDFGNNEGGILLQPSGGTAPYTASWFISGTLALKDSGLSATTGGISYYGYEVEDNAGCIYRGTAALPYATAVYPGDCNHDQLVDMNDLLEIGLHFNKTGPARPNASLTWTPQVAPLWNDTLLNGKDIRHVDTDGNGTISQPDTLAIIQNFGNTHVNQKNGDGPGPKVFLTIPASTYNPGDTMIATINMGTMDTTAVDVYGLTFDLTYDTSLVEQNSVSQSFNTSWLGTKNVDMLTLSQNDAPNGIIYTGIVRNDMATRTGHGKIGELIVVIDDHLAKRTWPLVLDIINVNAIDENGNPLPISGLPTEVTVSTSTTSLTATSKDTGWKLAPNPTSNRVLVEVRQDVSGAVFIVQDATGRLVLTHPLNDQQQLSVALDGLGAGTYFAHVEGKSYLSSTKKLVIVR